MTPLLDWKGKSGRRHKDYLDKSEIGSTRNPERNSHQILSNAKSSFIVNEIHTYRVSERKDRNRHGSLKQFGPKLQ